MCYVCVWGGGEGGGQGRKKPLTTDAIVRQAIDMWAIGCIFGELLTKPPGPLFQGLAFLRFLPLSLSPSLLVHISPPLPHSHTHANPSVIYLYASTTWVDIHPACLHASPIHAQVPLRQRSQQHAPRRQTRALAHASTFWRMRARLRTCADARRG